MKGNNELHLNTATMIEALQYWLDDTIRLDTPTVTAIKAESGCHGIFIVTVSSDVERPDPKKEP